MLKLSLLPDEYVIINGNIVVQVSRVAGGRAGLNIEAPREIPVVRGTVLERNGEQRPNCLTPPRKKTKYVRDKLFPWNDDRERAVRAMYVVLERLEQQGAVDEVKVLRKQLERIIPPVWEDEIFPEP